MKYPDDFNTPAFPAGRFVAVSRFMGTAVMCVFFLIICVCGIILWVKQTQNISPFLISINPNGERWTVVAHDNHKTTIPAYYVLQESLLNKFVRNWFSVSNNPDENNARWAKCNRDSPACTQDIGNDDITCAIYCPSDDAVWDTFEHVVLPTLTQIATVDGDVWAVKSLSMKPVDSVESITANGGFWKLNIAVQTNTDTLYFTGFARVGYDIQSYPKTMGYYVAEFYTYRMN